MSWKLWFFGPNNWAISVGVRELSGQVYTSNTSEPVMSRRCCSASRPSDMQVLHTSSFGQRVDVPQKEI